MMASYNVILSILGLVSCCFGIWLVVINRFAWRTILIVVIGLVMGQWWLIETIVTLSLWKFRGMAP